MLIKDIYLLEPAADAGQRATVRRAAGEALAAPPGVRPVRVTLSTALPEVVPDPRFDVVILQWFEDAAHRARFASWLASPAGAAANRGLRGAVEKEAGHLVVAEEHPMRGADWLARRWRDGGPKVKHMAIARRAVGLTSAEFSDRWRNRAGRVGSTPIPVAARGSAYVQNHPLPDGGRDWPFDAVNEVYFDDLDGLRGRVAWFAGNLDGQGEDDLVSRFWFVAVREEVLRP